MSTVDHTLSESALQGIELPAATLETLRSEGVPAELRLPAWAGPTLFSSELGQGRLVATTDEGALIVRSGVNEGYLIGSVRETSGDGGVVYSAFSLRKRTGEVLLLDAVEPREDRFVNSTLAAFLASMSAFHTAWAHLIAESREQGGLVRRFRDLLSKLDPRALEDADHYWPAWVDELS